MIPASLVSLSLPHIYTKHEKLKYTCFIHSIFHKLLGKKLCWVDMGINQLLHSDYTNTATHIKQTMITILAKTIHSNLPESAGLTLGSGNIWHAE